MADNAKQSRGRFRTIHMKMWADGKFRALSPMQPSGQSLWVFLLTGPHTGPIPGLFEAGRAAMAETLGWPIEAFDKAFGEVLREGLIEVDWTARIVWIPKAVEYNKPQSPNVILSWANDWLLLPECDLKLRAREALRAFIYGLGEAYEKAFVEVFGKPFAEPSGTSRARAKQEQEQEQEVNLKTKGTKQRRGHNPRVRAREASPAAAPLTSDAGSRPGKLSLALRQHGVSDATPSNPRIRAAAEHGVTEAEVIAAVERARVVKGDEPVRANYAVSIAERLHTEGVGVEPPVHANGGGYALTPLQQREAEHRRVAAGLTRPGKHEPETVDVQAVEVRHVEGS